MDVRNMGGQVADQVGVGRSVGACAGGKRFDSDGALGARTELMEPVAGHPATGSISSPIDCDRLEPLAVVLAVGQQFGADFQCGSDHVFKGGGRLGRLAGFQATVWVDPDPVGVDDGERLAEGGRHLCRWWYPR